VTDCSGLALELGDENIPVLGEVSFFARAMSQIEMEEVMSAGHTLNSIAQGKSIFTPESTSFDESKSVILEGFADAKNERSSAISEREVQGSLTRGASSSQASEINEPLLNVSSTQCNITARAEFSAYGPETSCKIITLTDQDGLLDTTTGKMYFPLIKREYMPEGRRLRDRAFYYRGRPSKDLLKYDPVLFPSWCGKSATFSVWWDPRESEENPTFFGGYIVTNYERVDAGFRLKWSLFIGDGGVHSFGLGEQFQRINTPITFDFGTRRHVAIVFNHLTDKLCAYADGAEIGCNQLADGVVAGLDCAPTAYMGLNHRIPGAWQPTTVMQVQSNPLTSAHSPQLLALRNENDEPSFLSLNIFKRG